MSVRAIVGTAFVVLLTSASVALGQQTPEGLLRAGIYAEEVQGDLERAIEIFRNILTDHPESRAVGAKAQLHIGLCLEILGLGEAQQAYRTVIDDYSDHRDEVAVARERLATLDRALAELNRQPTFRKIEIASRPENGVLSPEGSKLAFTSGGSVWVVPLEGKVGPDIAGEPIRLTEPMGTHGIGLSWSANGEWIAFNARQEDEQGIYVIPAAGGEPRRIPGNHYRGALIYSHRLSLSPDGKTLAFALHDPDADAETEFSPYNQAFLSIYTTPVEGGQPTLLTPIWSIEPAFSPDGRFIAYVKFQPAEGGEAGDWHQELWVIPAAGGTPVQVAESIGAMMPVWSPDSRLIAFLEGQEIWVVPISEDGAPAGDPTRSQLPRESYGPLAGWTSHGELAVFMNAPTHQAVYTVPAQGGNAVQVSPEGPAFHPRWTPDGKSIVYRSGNRFSFAAVPSDGGEVRDIPIVSDAEITPGVPGGGVHVSPDGKKIVFMGGTYNPLRVNIFTVPIEGGAPTQVTESVSVPELDTQDRYPCWSPDGSELAFIRYRAVAEGDFRMNVYTVPAGGGEPKAITTDADSVTWAEVAYSPDGQMLAYFTHTALKIRPMEGGEARVVAEIEEVNFHTELAWAPDGERIAYTGPGSIWTVSIDGGQPQEVRTGTLTEDAQNLHIDWSPDGTKIVFTASMGGESELWMMSGFLPEGR